MGIRFFIMFLVVLFLLQPAHAFCPVADEADIEVRVQEAPLRYDYSPDIAKLQDYNRDHMGLYLGLTLSQIPANYKFEMKPYHQNAGKVCLAYDRILLTIMLNQEILIPREVKSNRCMSESVMEHEMKHVETNRDVIQGHVPLMEAAIRNATLERRMPKRFGPLSSSEIAPLEAQLRSEMDKVINHEFQKMRTAINKAQSNVDTPAEYERVKDQCLRDQRSVVGKFKKNWRLAEEEKCEAMRDDDAKEDCKRRIAERF